MYRIQKHLGNLLADITITNDKTRTTVRGEIFPFARRFHSATFNVVSSRASKHQFEASVGCSGNQFPVDQSIRLMDALKVAQDQASYYKDLCESLQNPQDYERVIDDMFICSPDEVLTDALMLTPSSTPAPSIERVLKLLNGGDRLGLSGGLRAMVQENFFDQPEATIDAVLSVCRAHSMFKIEDGDIAGAMDHLFFLLASNSVFAD